MATTRKEREETRKAAAKVREQDKDKLEKRIRGAGPKIKKWAKGIPSKIKAADERQKAGREDLAKRRKAKSNQVKAERIAKEIKEGLYKP